MDVFFVCTGNICRSPMAEALLRARLADVDPDVRVASAGLLFDGRPAQRNAIKAMERRGLDLGSFRSQVIGAELLAPASLVLGMEGAHVREVSVLEPSLFGRTSTLPRFVEQAAAHGPRRAGEDLASWVRAVGEGDEPGRYLVADPALEVEDPMGQSGRAFRACADRLDDLISRLVELTWPTPARGTVAVGRPLPGGTHADRHRR